MSVYTQSGPYSLYGYLDGKTVTQIREMLDQYPDDAVCDVQSIQEYHGEPERDEFRFIWNKIK